MKLKNTLILLLVAGAIYAFIYFFESKQPTTQEASAKAGRVVTFDRDKVTGITIKSTETKIDLHKKDGAWYIDAPIKDRADSMAVNQLFTTTENLKSESAIPTDKGGSKDMLKDFGLTSSDTRITFTGDSKPVELLIGTGDGWLASPTLRIATGLGTDLLGRSGRGLGPRHPAGRRRKSTARRDGATVRHHHRRHQWPDGERARGLSTDGRRRERLADHGPVVSGGVFGEEPRQLEFRLAGLGPRPASV